MSDHLPKTHYLDPEILLVDAVLAVGLVAFVALLAITALLWGMGLEPTFTR